MSQEMNHKRSMIVHYQGDCNWQGNFPRDKVPDPRSASLSTCLGRCKTMIDEIKNIIDINEKLVRMGCSPGYINGSNGNHGIWKTILVSGWEQKSVKECLQSAALKNGKYRVMEYGYEYLYDIEDAVKMMTSDDKKYLKKYEDHIGYHENIKQTCIQLKNEIEAECKQKGLNQPHINIYGFQSITKPPIKAAKAPVHIVAAALSTDTGCAKKKATPKKKVIEAEVVISVPNESKFVEMCNGSKMMYHGTTKHESNCDDHTFWLYAPTKKLQMKWDTHLPVSTYCNNHIPLVLNWTTLPTFKCLGHTNPADFISAQKEWKENGWTEEWAGLDAIRGEANNDEPEELFVGKKSYVSQ